MNTILFLIRSTPVSSLSYVFFLFFFEIPSTTAHLFPLSRSWLEVCLMVLMDELPCCSPPLWHAAFVKCPYLQSLTHAHTHCCVFVRAEADVCAFEVDGDKCVCALWTEMLMVVLCMCEREMSVWMIAWHFFLKLSVWNIKVTFTSSRLYYSLMSHIGLLGLWRTGSDWLTSLMSSVIFHWKSLQSQRHRFWY